MPKVEGYYNTKNETFLGPMNTETGHTPRFIEGVCWGTFNTDNDTFVPLTNPMVIEGVLTFDEDPETGKTRVSGIKENVGDDIVSKGPIQINNESIDKPEFKGVTLEERKKQLLGEQVLVAPIVETKEEPVVEPKPIKSIEDLPKLDLDNLF